MLVIDKFSNIDGNNKVVTYFKLVTLKSIGIDYFIKYNH